MIKVYALCSEKIGSNLIGADLIMWAQGTDFSHLALLFMLPVPTILESVSPLSHSLPQSEWISHYQEKERFLIGEISEDCAKCFIDCMVDIPYSLYQLFLISLQNLARKILKDKVKLAVNNGDLICTEIYTMFVQVFRNYVFDENKNLVDLVTAYKSMKELEIKNG